MRLKAIMTAPVEAISPSASVHTAERRLKSKGIHHLVVVDHGTVVGLVTADTLSSRQAEGAKRVGDAMIRNLAVATPEMTVRQAAALMTPGHVQTALPVVDNSRLVGIVSISDLLDLACGARHVPA